MISHKTEALNALDQASKMLARPEVSVLNCKLVQAILDHAMEHIEAMQELKRFRKKKEPSP